MHSDGSVWFGSARKAAGLHISPVSVLDGAGADATPAGARWRLRRTGGNWWLVLRLDDARLPLPYTIDPSVSAVSVSASSLGAGAYANWSANFTTSSTGALAAGGTITVTFPTWTGGTIPANPAVALLAPSSFATTCTATATTATATVTITLANASGQTCALGNSTATSLKLLGITNTTSTGSKTISVKTSKDTTAVNATATIAAAAAPTAISFAGAPQTGAALSSWTVGFTSTATGALVGGSTITAVFNSSFAVPAAPAVTLGSQFASCSATASATAQTVTVTLANSGAPGSCLLPASTATTVKLTGLTNPAAGSYANTGFTVKTRSNTTTASPTGAVVIAAATSVSGVSFTGSPQTGGARASWTVGFTSSNTTGAALVAGAKITTIFPAGFAIPATPTVTLVNGFSSCAASASTSSQTVTVTLADSGGTCSLPINTAASVRIAGITNPAAGSYLKTGFTVKTSTDTAVASPAANVVIATATSPTSVGIGYSTRSAGATATVTPSFTSSATGALAVGDTITVRLPTGTVVPASPTIALTGGFAACSATGSGATNVATVTLSGASCALPNLTQATLTVAGVTNPSAGTYANTTLSLATSTDTVAANPSSGVVIFGPATKLIFTAQPTGSGDGVAFPTQPVVTVVDSGGRTVADNSSQVTLAITAGSGSAGAALTCTTNPLGAVNGVASFSGCRISPAGTGYTLTGTDGSLTAATSTSFNITTLPPQNTALPVLSGTATESQILSGTNGSWANNPTAYTYQWRRCSPSGAACVDIAGATANSYALTFADVGLTARLDVTATNAGGSSIAESAPSSIVAQAPPQNTGVPSLSGIANERQVLSVGTGTWTGSPTSYSYQWRRCDTSGSGCSDIGQAAGTTYTLAAGDVGATVRVAVTASNGGGSSTANSLPTATVGSPLPPYAAAVLADSAEAYWRLQEANGATTVADLSSNGHSATPTNVTFGIASPLTSETGDTAISLTGTGYFQTGAAASFRGTGGLTAEAWVYPTANGFSTIASNRADAMTGWWVGLYTGSTQVEAIFPPYFSISSADLPLNQWSHVAAVYNSSGATKARLYINGVEANYAYRDAGFGDSLSDTGPVRIGQAPNGDLGFQGRLDEIAIYGTALSTTRIGAHFSAAWPGVSNTASPSVSGTTTAGFTLTASAGSWTGSPTSFAYQWRRCDSGGGVCADISGAVSATYLLTASDVGSTIRVAVTAANPGNSGSATSAQTATVAEPSPPAMTSPPTVSGLLEEGQILTATSGTWSGSQPISFSYQWQQCVASTCSDITGATSSTYTATADDVGATLRVTVHATNSIGSADATHQSPLVASPSVTLLPYRDPAYADALWTLLVASWPNAYSAAEQALGQTPADVSIKTGLWKARTAAGVLPPLGWIPLTWRPEPWGLGWKIARSTGDTKWVHLIGDPGLSNFVPDPQTDHIDDVRWQHWCDTPEHPACPGGYYGGIAQPQWIMDFHRTGMSGPPNGGWHIGRFPDMSDVQDSDCHYLYMDYYCAWGTSPVELAWNHTLWDFNTTSAIDGTLVPFRASDGKCGISQGEVDCFTRSLTDAQMGIRIQVDDFASFANQSADVTWPVPDQPLYPWAVPETPNLEPARAVLDQNLDARNWVNQQLSIKPSMQTAPEIFGLANQGQTFTGTLGTWNAAAGFSYHWLRCNASGGSCFDLYGTMSQAYLLTALDLGSTLRFKVTASNANGSATAISDPSPLVLAPIEQLATDYRPALLFDSDEHYRPITVDSLLAERDGAGNPVHKHCDVVPPPPPLTEPVPVCHAVGSVADLVAPPTNQNALRSFLSTWTPNGDPSDEFPYSGDPSDFRSPTCASSSVPVRDCNNTQGIYYHYGQSVHGYRFIDYWFYYRYNPFPTPPPYPDDNHEGDWEGLTVELDPAPNPPAVTGIVLDQHGHLAFRLPQAFTWCSDGAASRADCNPSSVSPSGVAHAGVFVAEGSHASYEQRCTQDCFNPVGDDLVHEHSHDGEVGWSDNSSSACATASTGGCVTNLGSWAAWTGCWGGTGTCSDDIIPFGTSPKGPAARQGGRYGCTEVGWACSETPEGGPVPFNFRKGTRTEPRAVPMLPVGTSLDEKCSSWMDRELAASACSPASLKLAHEQHQLSKPGQFSLLIRGRRTATAPGLVQVVGTPVRLGELVRLRGKMAKDVTIILICRVGRKLFEIRLSAVRARSDANIRIIADGRRPHVLLHSMKATVKFTLIPARRTTGKGARNPQSRRAH